MIRLICSSAAIALTLLVATPVTAQQAPAGAQASFLSLEDELEGMQAQTTDGRTQRLTLTGQPCRSTVTTALSGNERERASTYDSEWEWAKAEEALLYLPGPVVLMEDNYGDASWYMDTEARAERVIALVNALRRQCRGR